MVDGIICLVLLVLAFLYNEPLFVVGAGAFEIACELHYIRESIINLGMRK